MKARHVTSQLFALQLSGKFEARKRRLLRPLQLESLEDRRVPAVFSVTNTDDSGAGSLRQAILGANGTGGLDEIDFNIPGAGVHTITPASASLPFITDPVVIDGYTQPGAKANTNGPSQADNAVLQIELSGSVLASNAIGLVLLDLADGSTIRGLVIDQGFSRGIVVQASDVHIEGCFIGIDPTGTTAKGNGAGIFFDFGTDTSNGVVGGTTPEKRNVISGNNPEIFFQGGTKHFVQGNLIGTDATGLVGLSAGNGITINPSTDNVIGGSTLAARNVINSNSTAIFVGNSTGTMIQGNLIQVLIDGVTKGTPNGNAVFVDSSASNTQVGGLTSTPGTGLGNVIGGHIGVQIGGSNNVVQGNLIGTDATGTKALGIDVDGVQLTGSSNTVGGPSADARNVISAGGRSGIILTSLGSPVTGNLIQNNFIGTDITGTPNSMGNGDGVLLQVASGTQIKDNIIAGNASRGVDATFSVTNNAILGNSIFANGSLGIDLAGGTQDAFGVTQNDPGDGDTGPNGLQNYPVITSASIGGATTTVIGSLNSNPSANFRIEFFANNVFDPSTFGEGKRFLGSVNVTTDGAGDATFNATGLAATTVGEVISATATSLATMETSEFSKTFPTVLPQVNDVVVNGGAVQRSRVLSVDVIFTQVVNLPANPANAFTLTRNSDNAVVNLAAVVNNSGTNSVVTLTFTGGAVNAGSLADGRYTLTVLALQVSNVNGQLDGNADGIAGDDFVLVGSPSNAPKLFRLYGDADGSGAVDSVDFGAFRTAFNSNNSVFDFDGDGIVDGLDFGRFRQRFGVAI